MHLKPDKLVQPLFSTQTAHLEIEPLTALQVELAQADRALVVDVRTDLQFDDAHIPGAVCNPAIRPGFGTKLAWIADRDYEVIFVGRDDEELRMERRTSPRLSPRSLPRRSTTAPRRSSSTSKRAARCGPRQQSTTRATSASAAA